jgi:4-amino-4-deoxy-L-arabinose transferase-like glycosyltransferase
MVDGLSQARQPAPGIASPSLAGPLAGIADHPWAAFLVFAAAHAALWTVLPSVLYANLPLDLIEALTYGREWQLGYDKLPPLPWWLVEIAYRAFNSDVAYYALGQISVLAAFAAVWAVMLRIASPAAAAASVLIIDGLHFFNFTAPKFNHDVAQLPFWALAGLAFHGALRTGRAGYWAVLGAALGLAFWAKYFVVVLALPLALFLLIDPRARRCLATPGPYLAAAVSLVIMAPHLVWLVQNDWLPLKYVASRAKETSGLIDHLAHPAVFTAAQLFWLLPAFIIALPLYRRSGQANVIKSEGIKAEETKGGEKKAGGAKADGYDRRIIGLLAFGPAVAVTAGSALSGRGLITMWGYPLWLFLGPWIVMSVAARIDRAAMARTARAWGTVTACYVLSFVVQYAVLPHFDHRYRATLFPGDRLAEEISARYRAQTGTPLRYVVSTMWIGGNISHYSADHPRTLIDGDPRRAPWIDPAGLAASGGVVVWTEGDPNAVPADFAGAARNAAVQPPFTLPMRRGNGEVTVGWGVIPPI